jgi:exopolysaccharide production protein ExoY
MAKDIMIGHRPTLNQLYAGEGLNLPISWVGTDSVANILRKSASVLYPADHRIPASREDVSEWERLSLAIHKLPTNGLQYALLKRLLDILVICAILPCLLPLLLIVALVVKVGSPGPIFYRQKRVGRFGREFTLWKFRSMQVNGDEILRKHFALNPDAELEWIQTRKLRNDPRVTRMGRVLRQLSLDELPQFINVMEGSMSLVGPRPIVSAERESYRDAYLLYASAKPGLSGLWQVSGRSDLSYERRVALDAEYVNRWNLALDLQILWKTAGVVWGSKGAV